MKLITAIVSKDDSNAVQNGLVSAGFTVTRIATAGGFLRAGNVTFFVGADDVQVEAAIQIIAEHSRQRKQLMPSIMPYGMEPVEGEPIEVTIGGATVFVQNVERFEKL